MLARQRIPPRRCFSTVTNTCTPLTHSLNHTHLHAHKRVPSPGVPSSQRGAVTDVIAVLCCLSFYTLRVMAAVGRQREQGGRVYHGFSHQAAEYPHLADWHISISLLPCYATGRADVIGFKKGYLHCITTWTLFSHSWWNVFIKILHVHTRVCVCGCVCEMWRKCGVLWVEASSGSPRWLLRSRVMNTLLTLSTCDSSGLTSSRLQPF